MVATVWISLIIFYYRIRGVLYIFIYREGDSKCCVIYVQYTYIEYNIVQFVCIYIQLKKNKKIKK